MPPLQLSGEVHLSLKIVAPLSFYGSHGSPIFPATIPTLAERFVRGIVRPFVGDYWVNRLLRITWTRLSVHSVQSVP